MKPKYEEIKSYIVSQIESGVWQQGERIASENELTKLFGVSRMTANRAIKELTDSGLLSRVFGLGTFVAVRVPQAPLFEIKNIAEEIEARGNQHKAKVVSLLEVSLSDRAALEMELPEGTRVYRSVIVHYENGTPVQLEDRYVNPVLAPEYIKQDFEKTTPNKYLMEVTPFSEAEHIIEAVLPDQQAIECLAMTTSEPCLLIRRRTWVGSTIASYSKLLHPGNRYRLGGRFVREGAFLSKGGGK